MATSGSRDFQPNVAEWIEEAYERCGLEMRTAYDARTARRSLNILFADWANRGLNQWTISNVSQTLTEGTDSYSLNAYVVDVLDVVLRRTENSVTTDYQMNQIGRSEYWNIPNKATKARPTQYFLDKQETPKIYVWPAPENSTDIIKMNQILRIEDADTSVNDVQVPFRFYPCLVAGLAYYISQKRAPERMDALKAMYEDEFARALAQDESRASLMVKPNMRSYGY
ncbi:MAG TPA: hypothetical protein DCE27_03755 [Xanthomarina gelatinilytica]|nr:hypothetical protein [Xanthomarina gelatinilytica]|tara:strand:+ start:778 stop:1455 length:678 start_codon:yes stop_codon:yes gene_type:complete